MRLTEPLVIILVFAVPACQKEAAQSASPPLDSDGNCCCISERDFRPRLYSVEDCTGSRAGKCSQRLKDCEPAENAWSESGHDIDGDGKTDTVRLYAQNLYINGIKKKVQERYGYGLGKVIDLTPSKPGKQIALATLGGAADEFLTHWWIFEFDGKAIRLAGKLRVYDNEEGIVVEDGLIKDVGGFCGITNTTHWALKSGKLVKVLDKTEGKRDPDCQL
jgi:hypothetical protein